MGVVYTMLYNKSHTGPATACVEQTRLRHLGGHPTRQRLLWAASVDPAGRKHPPGEIERHRSRQGKLLSRNADGRSAAQRTLGPVGPIRGGASIPLTRRRRAPYSPVIRQWERRTPGRLLTDSPASYAAWRSPAEAAATFLCRHHCASDGRVPGLPQATFSDRSRPRARTTAAFTVAVSNRSAAIGAGVLLRYR